MCCVCMMCVWYMCGMYGVYVYVVCGGGYVYRYMLRMKPTLKLGNTPWVGAPSNISELLCTVLLVELVVVIVV